jgi:hypothetical protein
MILEQDVALGLQRTLDHPGKHAKHPRKKHAHVNLIVEDVDGAGNRLAHRGNVEVELIAGPPGLDLSTAGDLLLELVYVVGDPPPRLVLAEVVGDIDVDGLSHSCDVARRSALFKPRHESIIAAMRWLLTLLAFLAAPALAQAPPTPSPPQPAMVVPGDPASPYITVGQDEAGYRNWYLAEPSRAAAVKSFNDYLVAGQVSGILPTWQLLRTATAWRDCGQQPFEVPPPSEWPHMVQTLRYVRDYVIPAVGPVEPVSVYRNPTLNQCAGGAPESAHKDDSAIDMVPLRPIDRVTLMRSLCGAHSEHGAPYNAGLGFYAYLRFHVDSMKYRRWNMDPAVAAECPPLIHPEDIASVGQPLPTPVIATPVATPPPAQPAPQPLTPQRGRQK